MREPDSVELVSRERWKKEKALLDEGYGGALGV